MKLKYTGAFDADPITLPSGKVIAPHALTVNGVERRGLRVNHQFEVADEDAGRPPEPRLAEAFAELAAAVEAHDHTAAARLRDEITNLDHGDGLLAQVDNFQAVATDKPKSKETDK